MTTGYDDIEATSRRIADAASKMWGEIDSARRLPDELVEMLRDSGLLRAGAPAEVGGLELPPQVGLRAAEELARGDASTGLVRVDRDHQHACSSRTCRRRVATSCSATGAAWPRACGRHAARGGSVDGGVVVSGRWAFCSGIRTPTCCSPDA